MLGLDKSFFTYIVDLDHMAFSQDSHCSLSILQDYDISTRPARGSTSNWFENFSSEYVDNANRVVT